MDLLSEQCSNSKWNLFIIRFESNGLINPNFVKTGDKNIEVFTKRRCESSISLHKQRRGGPWPRANPQNMEYDIY